MTVPLDWSPQAAAAAAEERVRGCRERMQELRERRPFDPARAARARDAVADARARYAAAENRRRLRAVMLIAATARSCRRTDPPAEATTPLRKRMSGHGIGFVELFDRYFSLGGVGSAFEVDGYLHDVMPLPAIERTLLEHALWELTDLPED